MKRLILAFSVCAVLAPAGFAQLGGKITSTKPSKVQSVNGQTGDVTITAGTTLPLPAGDTTYLQLNSSQTVTGAPQLKASSMTVIGTITSTTGFVGGSGTFTYLNVPGSTIATGQYNLVITSAPTAGQHLGALAVNGVNVIIGGMGDQDAVGSSAGAGPEVYDFVLGTTSVRGANVVTTNSDGFRAVISSINARGSGSFYVQSGTYTCVAPIISTGLIYAFLAPDATLFRNDGGVHCLTIGERSVWTGGRYTAQSLATNNTAFILLEDRGTIRRGIVTGMRNNSNNSYTIIAATGTDFLIEDMEFRDNFLGANGSGNPDLIYVSLNATGKITRPRYLNNTGNNPAADNAGRAGIVVESTRPVILVDPYFRDNRFQTANVMVRRSSGFLATDGLYDNTRQNSVSSFYFTIPAANMVDAQYEGVTIIGGKHIGGTSVIYVNASDTARVASNMTVLGVQFIRPTTAAINFDRNVSGTLEDSFVAHCVVQSTGTLIRETAASVRTKKRDNVSGSILHTDTASD